MTLALREPLSPDVVAAYRECRWTELALQRQGWTGERLQKTARRVCRDYANANIPYLADHRRDELVDFVVEKALVAVMRFKPDHPTTSYGQNGGSHFDSWICDVMQHRCTDWHRSKREGNGDSRYGNDRRIVLVDSFDDDVDPHLDFEKLISESRLTTWKQAADSVGMELQEYLVVTMDRASRRTLRTAA